MLGPDQLADVEGDQMAIYSMARAESDDPPSVADLSLALMQREPEFARIHQEAKLPSAEEGRRPLVRVGVLPARARWLAAHEIAEWYYAHIEYDEPDVEERCDALGAALIAPRLAFRRAISVLDHSVYQLAEAFATTQSLALLRVGEVTGRPVALLRSPEPIYRGEPFAWPKCSSLRRALDAGRALVHPLAIRDEPNRVGLMARR